MQVKNLQVMQVHHHLSMHQRKVLLERRNEGRDINSQATPCMSPRAATYAAQNGSSSANIDAASTPGLKSTMEDSLVFDEGRCREAQAVAMKALHELRSKSQNMRPREKVYCALAAVAEGMQSLGIVLTPCVLKEVGLVVGEKIAARIANNGRT